MKLLNRHITKTVLSAILLMILLLASLQIFILFVDQINDIGQGDYTIWAATSFVLYQAPYQVYLFFPMICLLGAIIGLGMLANHHELVVMRAAGMSVIQIGRAVISATLLPILIACLLGETILPQLVYQSNDIKTQALSGGQTLKTSQGIWLRHLNDFISIGHVLPGNILENIFQYRLNKQYQLIMSRHIKSIQYVDAKWHAFDIDETQFHDASTSTKHIQEQIWDIAIRPTVLGLGRNEPEEMTLKELYQYVYDMKKSKNITISYEIAFWVRVFWPLTAIVMILLAIPFIFGPLRSTPIGAKLLAGSAAGFSFFILNRFFGPLSQVFHLSPILAAIAPTFLFAGIGLLMMKKAK